METVDFVIQVPEGHLSEHSTHLGAHPGAIVGDGTRVRRRPPRPLFHAERFKVVAAKGLDTFGLDLGSVRIAERVR